jgi:hypothetical protein
VLSDYSMHGQHLHQGVPPGLRLSDSYTSGCPHQGCLWLSPLLVNQRRKQMHVHPLRLDVHIDQGPPSASTFSAALKGSMDVFILAVAMKR